MSRLLIITGASAGIGAATARLAAVSGWQNIVVHYGRDLNGANETAAAIEAVGAKAHVIGADVSEPDAIAKMFRSIRELPAAPVDLVNNAGIVAPKGGIADLTPDRVKQVFDVNVLGAIEVARQAVMLMRDWGQGGGIVNVSSMAAKLGSPREYTDYAASKGAIDTFSTGLADELAPEGIRVNVVRPGPIETEIHAKGGQPDRLERISKNIPMGRAGKAEECAEAILWLLSDRASYCTRSFVDVSGGR
ncbi:SDR family oxidoreductase [Thalassococcus lentus]|uniref:SDR family oxidoreductase n=1 Tax=Thalassococcus lentus TaxID=1210524 RepID=A0ABT4XX76_9RHOB|nr:SDR family oxidoreductase [Thalassococcus lentus]MDA7426549.1 SDR family oxidoreductase [Thalassococcus lentus]